MNTQELSNDFFRSEFPIVRNAVIDINCLQDIRLGTLLSLIKTEAEYKYLVSKIPMYNDTYSDRLSEIFSVLDISEETLDNQLYDKHNHRRISIMAPNTNLYNGLTDLIATIDNINKRGAIPINSWNLYMCCGPLEVKEVVKKPLETLVKSTGTSAILHFMNGYPHELDVDTLNHIDYFLLNDIISFVSMDNLSGDLLFNKHKFYKATILGTEQLDPSIELDGTESLQDVFVRTANFLSLFCDKFSFVKKTIPIKE